MSEYAKAIIRESIAAMERAESPDALRPRICGEVDFAYKFGLIGYAERDNLINNVLAACGRRRNELHRAKLARLGITE